MPPRGRMPSCTPRGPADWVGLRRTIGWRRVARVACTAHTARIFRAVWAACAGRTGRVPGSQRARLRRAAWAKRSRNSMSRVARRALCRAVRGGAGQLDAGRGGAGRHRAAAGVRVGCVAPLPCAVTGAGRVRVAPAARIFTGATVRGTTDNGGLGGTRRCAHGEPSRPRMMRWRSHPRAMKRVQALTTGRGGGCGPSAPAARAQDGHHPIGVSSAQAPPSHPRHLHQPRSGNGHGPCRRMANHRIGRPPYGQLPYGQPPTIPSPLGCRVGLSRRRSGWCVNSVC